MVYCIFSSLIAHYKRFFEYTVHVEMTSTFCLSRTRMQYAGSWSSVPYPNVIRLTEGEDIFGSERELLLVVPVT